MRKQRLHSSKLNKNHETKFNLRRKIFYWKNYARYLGMKTEENLNWKFHVHDPVFKLNRANAVLSKIRHFGISDTLRFVYFAIFNSHVNNVCTVWGLTRYLQHKVSILQMKMLRTINFPLFNKYTSPLFKKCNFLKFVINVKSCVFVNICSQISKKWCPIYCNLYISDLAENHLSTQPLNMNHLQDRLREHGFLCVTPKSLKLLLLERIVSIYNI